MSKPQADRQKGQPPPIHLKAAEVLNHFIGAENAIDLHQGQEDIEGGLIGWWQFWTEENTFDARRIRQKNPGIAEYLDQLVTELVGEQAHPSEAPETIPEPEEALPEPTMDEPEKMQEPVKAGDVTNRRAVEVLYAVTMRLEDRPDVAEFTDEQCRAELKENIGLLHDEDRKAILEQFPEDGEAVWEHLMSFRAAEPEQKHESKSKKAKQRTEQPKEKPAKASTVKSCKNRRSGYLNFVGCNRCADKRECQKRTLNQLVGVAVDVSKNMLQSEEDEQEIWHQFGIGDLMWKHGTFDDFPNYADEVFDSLRGFINEAVTSFLKSEGDDGIEEALRRLNPWTVYHLAQSVEGWGERAKDSYLVCAGPHMQGCHNCRCLEGCKENWLKYVTRIPHFITRAVMRSISGSAFKVLMCIASHANFVPNDPHFGMCWLKYDQIEEESGVKQPAHHIKKLKEKGFVQHEQIKRNKDGKFTTTNVFTVNWFGQLRDLGVEHYAKTAKASKKKGV